jgi:hypothetical protein
LRAGGREGHLELGPGTRMRQQMSSFPSGSWWREQPAKFDNLGRDIDMPIPFIKNHFPLACLSCRLLPSHPAAHRMICCRCQHIMRVGGGEQHFSMAVSELQ